MYTQFFFQVANILYLESPAGSGYSYAKTRRAAETSDTKQIHQIDQFLRSVECSLFLIPFLMILVYFLKLFTMLLLVVVCGPP